MVNCGLKRGVSAVSVLALLVGLSACAIVARPAPERLPAAEAAPRYEQLSADIRDVLNAAYSGLELAADDGDVTTVHDYTPGRCVLYIRGLESDNDLGSLAGGWKPVMETIASTLDDAGFPAITKQDKIPGGWSGISSEDRHGATLHISAKGSIRISITAKVSDEVCSLGDG